jgi:hypothetical protein
MTNGFYALIVVIALTLGARAQSLPNTSAPEPSRIWEIPALGYSLKDWSSLRLANNSDSPATFQVDVYCGRASRLPLDPRYTVEPHQTREIRLSAETIVSVLCWARVGQLSGVQGPGIQIRASLETLNGNQLEEFDRQPRQASPDSFWAIRGPEISGQQLYILNVGENPTILTFCIADKPEPKECRRKGVNPIRRLAKPRQAVIVDVKKFSKKYLIAESSEPGRAIIQIFDDAPGHRKVYTAESSISFDTPDVGTRDDASKN